MKPQRRLVPYLVWGLVCMCILVPSTAAWGAETVGAGSLQVRAGNCVYSGSPAYPPLTVVYAGRTLRPGTDYSASYRSNVNAGTASVSITGKGTYKGKQGKTNFTIEQAPASSISITGLKDSYAWDGKTMTPTVTAKYGAKTLKQGRDYNIAYKGNTRPGTATITISGARNFSGSKNITFKIGKASIKDAKVDAIKSRYTTSLSKVTPKPTVRFAGRTLKSGTDYTVQYKNNVKPGTASITIKGKGDYTGSRTEHFKLVNMGDDLARAACKLSYSRGVHYKHGKYPGTKKYRSVYKALGKPNRGTDGRGCDAGMCTVMRWSGYDKKFPAGCGTRNSGINKYLGYSSGKGTSSKWVCLGTYKKGKTKLLPGDVLFGKMKNGNSHVCMYVGKTIASQIYKKNLKGTDADVGKTTGNYVSSHFSNPAALGIGGGQWSLADASFYKNRYKVYRCIKPSNKHYRAGNAV